MRPWRLSKPELTWTSRITTDRLRFLQRPFFAAPRSSRHCSRRALTGASLDVVTVPFEALEPTYDFLGSVLAPYGLKLDYDRIKQTRPVIADMLR